MKQIRYAVVGAGHIAQIAMLPGFKHAKSNSRLVAFVTGTPKKSKVLSKKYGVDQIFDYGEYDTLLASGEIDAVYIALPNAMHCEFVCRALKAGIHVLCEKPLGTSSEECSKMVHASKKSGARLMTAYRLHFDKPNMDVIQLCRKGKLGDIKTFVSSFSYVLKDKNNIRLRPEEGGGPLWDIGIYCINAARYVFGENPSHVMAVGTRQPAGSFSKVNESVTAILKFSKDRVASFTCSFNVVESAYFEVYGDKGMARLENGYEYAFPPVLRTLIRGKENRKKYKKVDQFGAQLSYFSDCIRKNRTIEPSGEEGFTDVVIIEAIERSIASGKSIRVEYGRDAKEARPTSSMVKTLPPVRKPDLVDVQSPSGD